MVIPAIPGLEVEAPGEHHSDKVRYQTQLVYCSTALTQLCLPQLLYSIVRTAETCLPVTTHFT